jgi:2,3-bisphosphoglycerate-independent phosphoglycerate mutase
MDRDKRWDRVEKAYLMLTAAAGYNAARSARRGRGGLRARRDRRVRAADRDRRLHRHAQAVMGCCSPISAPTASGKLVPRCLTQDFSGFERERSRSRSPAGLGLVEYSEELNRFLATLFAPENLEDTFGEIVSRAGLKQLRIAETEKYAHVTFFFNGGRETVFPGEERILVPSPKGRDL